LLRQGKIVYFSCSSPKKCGASFNTDTETCGLSRTKKKCARARDVPKRSYKNGLPRPDQPLQKNHRDASKGNKKKNSREIAKKKVGISREGN